VNTAMADPFSAFPHKAPEKEYTKLKGAILGYLRCTGLSFSTAMPGQSALTLSVLQTASIMLQFGLFGSFSQDWDESVSQVSNPLPLRFDSYHEPADSAIMEGKAIICAVLIYIFDTFFFFFFFFLGQVVQAIIPLLDGRTDSWTVSPSLGPMARFESYHEPAASAIMEGKAIICAMLMYILTCASTGAFQ